MSTSSARYTDLYDYARAAEQIDYELMGQADRLINRLGHYEATCREPGFQTGGNELGSALRSYASHALPVDQRVRAVGEGFQRADARARFFLFGLPVFSIRDILFRMLRPGRVMAAEDERGSGRPTPTPGPRPVPTPMPPVNLYDGLKDRPSWLGEKFDRLREWINDWFGRDAPTTPPPAPVGTITNPVIIDNIQKPAPPALKMVRAEDVPLTIERQVGTPEPAGKFTPYYRGDGSRKSNCVWYAATALAAYTKGKIDLHAIHGDDRMGNGNQWAGEAQEALRDEKHPLHGYVDAVDKKPAAGTVIAFGSNKGGAGSAGHVAWVEEARLITGEDGKKYWELVISEENWSGNGWKGAESINTGDSTVKRWRRTVTYPVNPDDESVAFTDGIQFIHWNPGYEPDKPI